MERCDVEVERCDGGERDECKGERETDNDYTCTVIKHFTKKHLMVAWAEL